MKRIVKNVLKFLFYFLRWLFIHLFIFYYYDRKYLKGRWFEKGIYSEGWRWAWIDIWHRLLFQKNANVPWPCSPYIDCTPNVAFDPSGLDNFNQQGNYFQSFNGGMIILGKGTNIAKNVGIITSNHDFDNLDIHQLAQDVVIGENCWIGMNAIILPGVQLGEHTIVGAGAVVTKSFPEGHCVIVGNPARKIKDIE